MSQPLAEPVFPVRRLIAGSLFIAILVTVGLARRSPFQRPPQPDYGSAPSLVLVDQYGNSFESTSLAGHPYVVNFIFTSCVGTCPTLTAAMKRLQVRLNRDKGTSDTNFVSISVDPGNDTPAKLKEYADRFEAGKGWHFLTGDADAIRRAVNGGFHTAMGSAAADPNANLVDLVHGERFVLVDGHGVIQGYFEADKPEGFDALVNAVRAL